MNIIFKKDIKLSLHFALYILAIFFSLYGCNSLAQPYAEWSDLSNVEKSLSESFKKARVQNIPNKSDINIPSYPESDLLKLDEYGCTREISSLILVTMEPIEKIVKWYEKNLNGYPKSINESRVFFIEGYENFDYENNSIELSKRSYVSIREINGTLKRIAPKYKTSIEVGYKAKESPYCN